MIVHTLWAWRKREEGPELLEAWDEVAVESNREGWQEAINVALKSLEDDISELGYRLVDISVDYDQIMAMFWANEIKGEVVQ